jgi:hypothetical protein
MRLNLLLGQPASKVTPSIDGIYEGKIHHFYKFERMSTLKENAANHSFHLSSI